MYPFLLYGHLLGVVLLLLGSGMFLAGTEGLRRGRTVAELRTLADIAGLGTLVLVPGGLLLVGFGLALATLHWSLADPWIAASLVLVGLLGVNGLRAERWLRRVGRDPAQAGAPVHHGLNRATVAVLAEIEFLMTVKPAPGGLAASIAVMLALGALLVVTAGRERGRG